MSRRACVKGTVSALFLGPGECNRVEEPREGCVLGASFVTVVARVD